MSTGAGHISQRAMQNSISASLEDFHGKARILGIINSLLKLR